MFVPAWALRIAPYVGGILLATAAYVWAYSNGRSDERVKWQAKEVEAMAAAQKRETALRQQVDAASLALSMSTAENERLAKRAVGSVRNYYAAKPDSDVACLDPDVLRAIQEGDAAAVENPVATR